MTMSDSNGNTGPPAAATATAADDAMAARVEEGDATTAAAAAASGGGLRASMTRDDAGYERQASVSEAAEAAGSGTNAPVWLSWMEWPFHIADPKTSSIKLPEVAGWGMDSAGRGPLAQVGGYVGTAILRLATQAAGCSKLSCDQKIYGFLPSSLLTLTTSIIGVIAAFLMPIVGAIVDHTQYRRLMGIISGFLSVILIGSQIFISSNNWFIMLIIDAVQTFVYVVHTTAVFAYLPDLSLDQQVISHYTSRFNMQQHASQFVFVSLIIIAGQVHGTDKSIASSVRTAREGAAIAFTFGAVFIGYAWTFLFRPRPALSRVPPGSTLLTAGFKQVTSTMTVVWQKYRHLRWFMISLLFSPEAGAGVVLSIAVTYLTVFMEFSGQDFAKTSLSLMAGTIVGSPVAKVTCRILNPLNSYRLGLLLVASFVALTVAILKGPQHRYAAFGCAALWGVSMGIMYPSQRVLYCTLIPKGQETEFMGLFVFAGQLLGWLPALIFTIMNEKGVDIRWGMSVVAFFCVTAFFCTLPMGPYNQAVALVTKDSKDKLASVIAATTNNAKCAGDPTPVTPPTSSQQLAPPITVNEASTATATSAPTGGASDGDVDDSK